MKVAVQRRGKELELTKNYLVHKSDLHGDASILKHHLTDVKDLRDAKIYYAASRISGIVRGFLARFHYRELLQRRDATIVLQSLVRGRLGRVRWMMYFWLDKSVVKSVPALKILLERSTLLREAGSALKHWQEYFDPLTDSIWYYNPRNRRNVWDCPACFQHELVCTWDGFQSYGGLPSQGPCRKIFTTIGDYTQHMKTAHPWHCPACGTTNRGMCFPFCPACENTLSPDGEDSIDMMKRHVREIRDRLWKYMGKEDAEMHPLYSLQKSLVEKAMETRKKRVEEAIVLENVMQHMSKLGNPIPIPNPNPNPNANPNPNPNPGTGVRQPPPPDRDAAMALLEGKGVEMIGKTRVKITGLPWEDIDDMVQPTALPPPTMSMIDSTGSSAPGAVTAAQRRNDALVKTLTQTLTLIPIRTLTLTLTRSGEPTMLIPPEELEWPLTRPNLTRRKWARKLSYPYLAKATMMLCKKGISQKLISICSPAPKRLRSSTKIRTMKIKMRPKTIKTNGFPCWPASLLPVGDPAARRACQYVKPTSTANALSRHVQTPTLGFGTSARRSSPEYPIKSRRCPMCSSAPMPSGE